VGQFTLTPNSDVIAGREKYVLAELILHWECSHDRIYNLSSVDAGRSASLSLLQSFPIPARRVFAATIRGKA
jgi:hypothetical protein